MEQCSNGAVPGLLAGALEEEGYFPKKSREERRKQGYVD
jgi:hypothetical protein